MEESTPANPSPSPDSTPEPVSPPRMFTLFPKLPPELRAPIWNHALPRRIIKWTRTSTSTTFSAPQNSTPLFAVCKESRKAAMLYGEYISLSNTNTSSSSSTSCSQVHFSPPLDSLLFEPLWTTLLPSPSSNTTPDPLDTLPADLLAGVRSIMVHPHYTDERRRPAAHFERFPRLEQILVAADEKAVGLQSKFILGTVYDVRLYYAADVLRRKRVPRVRVSTGVGAGVGTSVSEDERGEVMESKIKIKTPYIAVGCLGWTGAERRKMHHGKQDTRELVAVFENEAQMKVYLAGVREEEWRFT
ncbi:hypothetical protein IFR05_017294, partial [Cadophora sp. M221]